MDDKGKGPTIEEMADLFEFFDTGRSGMISARDIFEKVKEFEILKKAEFD